MPEADKAGERYRADTPQAAPGFFLKGSHQLDWGMKNRLARVFNPASGRTVMLAVDHGYFQGPTSGLERIDLSIVPLLPQCDALFCTRGVLRSVIPADCGKPMVLRASGGPSILREELSDEQIALDMDDAVRLNAAGVGIQVFIGGEHETRSVHNMTRLVDAGLRAGMPVMGVTGVGKERAPRTAVGIDREQKKLTMLVVDGRKTDYSAGMSDPELGQAMLELGCWNALILDGGGSSTMVLLDPIENRVQVMNRPSDGHDLPISMSLERPVACVLGVQILDRSEKP